MSVKDLGAYVKYSDRPAALRTPRQQPELNQAFWVGQHRDRLKQVVSDTGSQLSH